MKEKDAIYMKEIFDEDGVRAAELKGNWSNFGGWGGRSEVSQH